VLVKAEHILGVARSAVRRWILVGVLTRHGSGRRQLDRDEVEQLAARRWRGFGSRVAEDSHWVMTPQVMADLGVSRPRVSQLVDRGFLPAVRTATGVRLFRRNQPP
jgi:hypothetical protein